MIMLPDRKGLEHCNYGGIHCVITGPTIKGMIQIHPLFPDVNIGAGLGMSIRVYEDEIESIPTSYPRNPNYK